MRRTPALALAATTLLLTAGCASSQGGETDAAAPAPAASATPVVEEPPSPGECLLGAWEQDLSTMSDQIAAMMGSAGEGIDGFDVTFEGTSASTFAKDKTTSTTSDVVVTMSTDIDGTALVMTMASAGTTTGSWTLEDDVLTATTDDTSGVTMDLTTTLDGVETQIPGMDDLVEEDELLAEGLPATATVECTEDELVLTTEVPGTDPMVQRFTR